MQIAMSSLSYTSPARVIHHNKAEEGTAKLEQYESAVIITAVLYCGKQHQIGN